MSRIAKNMLLLHQHTHVRTPRGIGAHAMAVGALRMVTDHFAHVVNLTPVRQPDQGESELICSFPGNVECRVLYERQLREPKARAMLLHLGAIPTILREVREADVVYLRLPHYPAFIASVFALVARKELMVSIHGSLSEVLLARRGKRPWWRLAARAIDAYQRMLAQRSVVTMVTGEHTRKLGGADAVVISQHQIETRDLHERADTCVDRPVRLLYVGLISKNKGMDDLLDALAGLVAQGVECVLTLAGSTSDYDVAAEIARRGLGRHVVVKGFVPWGSELFALHRASDIFVFPSLSEGIPKAPMEALSQSVPVVATSPGTSTYVEDGKSGLIVPPADPGALARAIRRMIEDSELRRRCIAQGLEVARQHTRDKTEERIRDILMAAFGAADAGVKTRS